LTTIQSLFAHLSWWNILVFYLIQTNITSTFDFTYIYILFLFSITVFLFQFLLLKFYLFIVHYIIFKHVFQFHPLVKWIRLFLFLIPNSLENITSSCNKLYGYNFVIDRKVNYIHTFRYNLLLSLCYDLLYIQSNINGLFYSCEKTKSMYEIFIFLSSQIFCSLFFLVHSQVWHCLAFHTCCVLFESSQFIRVTFWHGTSFDLVTSS
jgi:hypothetical protein